MISDIDEPISEATAVVVEVAFPETPFGGVQVFGIAEEVVQVTFSPVPAPQPEIPDTPVTPELDDVFGTTPLVMGQDYVDVAFPETLASSFWIFLELRTINVVDVNPLNIWPGIVTNKTAAGFRVQLNGEPDSVNYYLRWVVRPATTNVVEATRYFILGPDTGIVSVPNGFAAQIPEGSVLASEPVSILLSDGGAGGMFSPPTVVLTNAAPMAGFTYTPSSTGLKVISGTNDKGLINPDPVNFTSILAPTTGYSFSGPSSGDVSVPSTNFTVTLLPGSLSGSVIITPNDSGDGGVFTPSTVALTEASPSATFTYTPASTGTKTLACTNNRGLTDPANLSYVSSVPLHLLNNLISYYKMDDAGGAATLLDTHGSNNLTGQSGGTGNPIATPIGTGQYLTASGYFTHGSNSGLQVTGDFTFQVWVRVDDVAPNFHAILWKSDWSTLTDYMIAHDPAAGLQFSAGSSSGATVSVGSPVALYTWAHLICWYDSADGKLRMRINDATTYVGPSAAVLVQTAFDFGVGYNIYGLIGLVDEVGFWKRKLTSGEMTALYNGGAGLPYSSFTP